MLAELLPILEAGLQDAVQAGAQAASEEGVDTRRELIFQNLPQTWVIWLVILPLTVLFARWTYGGLHRLEPGTRVVLSIIRGLTILLCLLALSQPAWEIRQYTKVPSQVHILVDDSASMQRRDSYPDPEQRLSLQQASKINELAGVNRAALVQAVLEKDGGLVEKLRETHELRLYRFTRNPLPVQDLSELTSRGRSSPLGDALDLHLATTGSSPVDAVILVSDGRNNAGLPPIEIAGKYRAADLAVYTIGVGDPHPPRNVRIIGPSGPKEALRQEEVVFDVKVVGEGLAGERVTVTLEAQREGGAFIKAATGFATLAADGTPRRVRLVHAFNEAGDYTLRFKVQSFPDETSLEDNVDTRFLRVNDERIRVLYLEDIPRWEYRYVKNALKRVDDSIVMQSFLFDASGDFSQEHSDELLPLPSLPRSREELQKYHVILIGDVDPDRLGATEQQRNLWMRNLVEFVEFGGGVGFIYGEAFMPEAYRGTLIQDLLPVVLENSADTAAALRRADRSRAFHPRLANPAAPHDIALLSRDVEHNAELWNRALPGLLVYYPVQQARAGAEVILTHPDDSNRFGKRVLAAAGVYPRGRTFFMATDETWRWRKFYGEIYQDTFWRNVVRHLAESRLRRRDDRIDLRLDKVVAQTGDTVKITLIKNDDEFQPSSAREAKIFLRRADGQPEARTLRAVPGELGRFEGSFSLDRPATVSVLVFDNDNPADKVLAREDVLIKIPDREMSHSSQDKATLEQIAAASKGGSYLFLGDADTLAEKFAGRRNPDTEIHRRQESLWDSSWTLFLILGLLSLEWILRKRARLV